MHAHDPTNHLARRIAWRAFAAIVLAHNIGGTSRAEDVTFSFNGSWAWSFPPPTMTSAYTYGINGTLELGSSWFFSSMTIDSPQNEFGERLDFAPSKYALFQPQLAEDGRSTTGFMGEFVSSPTGHVGVYDRVYLSDGSWRQAVITITAYFRDLPSPPIYKTITVPISLVLSSPPGGAVTPEPSSIAMAGIGAAALGVLARRRMRAGRSEGAES